MFIVTIYPYGVTPAIERIAAARSSRVHYLWATKTTPYSPADNGNVLTSWETITTAFTYRRHSTGIGASIISIGARTIGIIENNWDTEGGNIYFSIH